MKLYFVILFIGLLSLESVGQIADSSLLLATWTSGKYDHNDSIVHVGMQRGGATTLVFNADGRVYYSTGFNCGFGSRMSGTWTLQSDTLIINFVDIEPYMEHADFDAKPRVLKYRLKYLTKNGLILLRDSGTEELFCKS